MERRAQRAGDSAIPAPAVLRSIGWRGRAGPVKRVVRGIGLARGGPPGRIGSGRRPGSGCRVAERFEVIHPCRFRGTEPAALSAFALSALRARVSPATDDTDVEGCRVRLTVTPTGAAGQSTGSVAAAAVVQLEGGRWDHGGGVAKAGVGLRVSRK